MSSSNQRPENRGFRSVLRCAIIHYCQVSSLSAPEPDSRAWRPRAGPALDQREPPVGEGSRQNRSIPKQSVVLRLGLNSHINSQNSEYGRDT